MQRLLVIGGSGFIGSRLTARIDPAKVVATYATKPIAGGVLFDVRTMRLADRLLRGNHRFSHAVVAQGINNIDYCATHRAETDEINVSGTVRVLEDLLDAGVTPLFISSDGVFNGRTGFRSETDAPDPILVYGRQKAKLEDRMALLSPPGLVARLSKVVGSYPDPRNIMSEWLDMVEAGQPIRCATDQILSPIDIDDVVDIILQLIEHNASGLYNVCGSETLSRHQLLMALLARTPHDFRHRARVEPCLLDDLPLGEPRPKDCSLSNRKLMTELAPAIRTVPDICERLWLSYRARRVAVNQA